MSLATPEKIRRLQRKLYVKAKQEPRHKVSGRGTRRFSADVIYGDREVLRLRWVQLGRPATA